MFTVRALLEEKPDFVCLKLDLLNAFNEEARAAMIEVFESEPSLRHLAQFFGITLAPVCFLEAGGVVWGETGEGATQGSPCATSAFTVGLQPSLVQLDLACQEGGGIAVAGADDCATLSDQQK